MQYRFVVIYVTPVWQIFDFCCTKLNSWAAGQKNKVYNPLKKPYESENTGIWMKYLILM